MKTYYTFKALKGLDENCADYISFADGFTSTVIDNKKENSSVSENCSSELMTSVIKGFKEKAGEETRELLKTKSPLDIVNDEIIPALNEVGIGYENKNIYLPQLLMSAESAKSAFEVIKEFMQNGEKAKSKATFVIATVKGDIHDIGKNIVKLLLENYGFDVIDLGKDVPPETVVQAVIESNAKLVGLSALMTTTVPAMEETIKLLKEKAPWCKVVVGGAVLTEDYANKIGADHYAKDAMETVRFAERNS
ncbi:MAG: corrinoid protein, partial [Clostridia bacterium]|nr:corrinoid protein [Clostridia bacterium]